MAAMLEREEWKAFSDFMALVAAGLLRPCRPDLGCGGQGSRDRVSRLLAARRRRPRLPLYPHASHGAERAPNGGRLCRRRDPRRRDRHRVLGARRLPGRRHHRLAARLSGAQSRSRMDELRALTPLAHLGRHLRLRRQRPDRHVLLCRAAHEPRAARGPLVALVRVLGLPALHRARRHRLPARRHPVERICRAGMVRGPLADRRLGGLFPRLRRHARQAAGAAYLCGELVLPRLHRHHRHAAHRQQSGGADLAASARRAT